MFTVFQKSDDVYSLNNSVKNEAILIVLVYKILEKFDNSDYKFVLQT